MKAWATRDEGRSGPLCRALHDAGLAVVYEPVIERRIRRDWRPEFVSKLGRDDWLILTSAYAVSAVASSTGSRVPRVAVVGDESRRLAAENGFRVELVAPSSNAKSLFAELRRRTTGGRVCYPRSSLVEPPESWGRVEISSPVLYDTAAREFDRNVIERIDIIAVASPSAVHAIGKVPRPFASIGPTTSAALRELGVEPGVEAPDRSFPSLANAIKLYAMDSRHHRA